MAVFHIVLRNLAVIDDHLLCKEVNRVGFLQEGIAFVLFIGKDALVGLGGSKPMKRRVYAVFPNFCDVHISAASDHKSPRNLCRVIFDRFHGLYYVRKNKGKKLGYTF